MTTPLTPDALRGVLRRGLIGFPLTDFDEGWDFAPEPFAERVRFLSEQGCAALFAAGGAGEFFSLTNEEYAAVLRTAVAARAPGMPLLGAAGGGTRTALAQVHLAEEAGVDGILLLPPYLTETTQEGMRAHVAAICRGTRLGVVAYSRANGRIAPETLGQLVEDCPNLVGFKDGVGRMEEVWAVRTAFDGRLAFLNGMPTAEVYAPAYTAMGVPTYSSAVYNFAPRAAVAFYRAVGADDRATVDAMMRAFFIPYGRLRSRGAGYAVSIVKAGVDAVGRSAGPVRPPLSGLLPAEREELSALIAALAPWETSRD